MTVEEAYETLAAYALACVGEKDWDFLTVKSDIYEQMSSSKVVLTIKNEDHSLKQSSVPFALSNDRNIATLFLRDNLLETTGERIWGMNFSLAKDGKMKINYSYDKPDNYPG